MNGRVRPLFAEWRPSNVMRCGHNPAMANPPEPCFIQHHRVLRRTVGWGVIVGLIQAVLASAVLWLPVATVHALSIGFIAAIYIGFAVADGRTRVIAVESAVAMAFVLLATAGVNGSAWLLVGAYTAHGLKDLWQARRHFVRGTRWWPPFCAAVDFMVAAILVAQIIIGMRFQA